jgi:hypothetical protein
LKAAAGRIINALLRPFGYAIAQRRKTLAPGYDLENEAREKINLVRCNTMVSFECLVTLYQQVRHCELNDIPGCYVECGVWKGGAAGLMALGNLAYGSSRRQIHLFDAFDDICEPDPAVDGERALAEVEQKAGVDRSELSGKLQPLRGVYADHGGAATVEHVDQLMRGVVGYDVNSLYYHVGWFQDTLPLAETGDIAILRLDGDWYASTKTCLEHLYDNVVSGGFVVIDDYGTYEGCRKAVDEFMEARGVRAYLNHVNADCRYWIKP